MASIRVRVAALLLLAACCSHCQPASARPSTRPLLTRLRRSSSSHYCGSHLANMLELVCGIGGVSVGKRDEPGPGLCDCSGGDGSGSLAGGQNGTGPGRWPVDRTGRVADQGSGVGSGVFTPSVKTG